MMRKVKLTDVCDILYGYPFDSSKFNSNNGIGVVRIRDIVRGYTETFTTEDCSEQYTVKKGDILVGMDGEFNIAKWQGEPAMLNQRVCKLSPKANLDKSYLFYQMPSILKSIEARTSFVTVKHLSAKELNNVYLHLPSIEEQRKIALVLSTIDLLIENYYTQLQDLGNLVKSRFIEMFGKEPNTVMLRDICSIITDGTHQPPRFVDQGIPFLFVSNIAGNTISYDCEKFISSETYDELYKRTPIEIGDIILSTVGSYGHPAVVKSNRKFLFQRHIAYLKLKKDIINPIYLHTAILSDKIKEQIEKKVKGIAQKTLNLSEIRTISVQLPPLDLQNQFADFVAQVDKSKLAVQQSLAEL